jgi:Holliday junction resolvasome RuvABC DNA-binding subunit
VPREAGGDHEPANLTLLCDGHHRLHHEGKLAITGKAPHQLMFAKATHTGPPRIPSDVRDAEVALTKMGFRAPEARSAVALASASLVTPTPEALVYEALRQLK